MNIESELRQIRSFRDRSDGALQNIENALEEYRAESIQVEKSLEDSQKAAEIIHSVAKSTQEELEFHLSDIVTMAMKGVFETGPSLSVSFVSRRGQIEVDMGFEEDGHIGDPLNDDGGGLVDVAAVALRFSCWTLRQNRTRPVIILDEPLKWLKGSDLPAKGARIIKEISEKLGLQIIMVSHDPELIEGADKVIRVGRKNRRSIIK